MMKLKENVSLLTDKMKKISFLLLSVFLVSCTSNTIFEKPKDLIPKDTMCLLMQDMMIASSAKYTKNKNLQRSISYMAFVYEDYKIDSHRFQKSNFYYTSKIDLYEEILTEAKEKLEEKKEFYQKRKTTLDSIRRDSIKLSKIKPEKLDTLKLSKPITNTVKTKLDKNLKSLDKKSKEFIKKK